MNSLEIGDLLEDKFIVVHDVVEHEDGSASVKLDIGADAMRILLQIGFITMIKEGIRKDDPECS
jgi:hypothetical protein